MSEAFFMSQKDRDRVHVLRQVLDKRLSWRDAGEQLGLGWRQVGRLCARVRLQGDKGALHGLKGRQSNRRLNDEVASMALSAIHAPDWEGFGPTFAQQKLEEYFGLRLGIETMRRMMVSSGLRTIRRRGARHRHWRERRACVGMMVQLDGSPHDWFEGRGARCVLLLYIDDATSRIMHAEFAACEDTLSLMRSTKAYIERFGRPTTFYVDKASIYKITRASLRERTGDEPATQFRRAMDELGIEVLCANSPQAKGRVERSFKTHQDRLIKELRLAGISTIEKANEFLQSRYIPDHNRRYAVPPASAVDAHKPRLIEHRFECIFSLREERCVMNDFTVRDKNKFFQLLATRDVRISPKDKVEMETRLDGSIHIRFKGRYLAYKALDQRPYRGHYAAQPSSLKDRNPFPVRREIYRDTPGQQRWLWMGSKKVAQPLTEPTDAAVDLPTAPAFV